MGYEENRKMLADQARVGVCFDACEKRIDACGGRFSFFFLVSFANEESAMRTLKNIRSSPERNFCSAEDFCLRVLDFAGTGVTHDQDNALKMLFSGAAVICSDLFDGFIVADMRKMPSRSVSEPEADKVMRGSRDGFTESLLSNAATVRRRIRSEKLTLSLFTVGRSSRTDLLLCYMDGRCDPDLLARIGARLERIDVDALSMGQESLAECLIPKSWYNPFPKFRYTERADAVCAMLLEGSIVILCDNTPEAMILPTHFFDFFEESDDFYFPPIIGSYLKLIRYAIFFSALFLTPLWYLTVRNPHLLPPALSFIAVKEDGPPGIFVQLLLVEFVIDGLKLASLNTPGAFGNSLGVVSGLILGDVAVNVGWLDPEVLLYMAFVAMANFTQPGFELGYAFKFMRIFSLLMIRLFDLPGFIISAAVIFALIACNKGISGKYDYLYPLIPFDARALSSLLFRKKLRAGKKKEDHPHRSR